MERLVDPSLDSLSELLRAIRIRSTIFCRSALTAPWGWLVAPRPDPTFHVLTEGDCWLEVEGLDGQVHLAAGDFAVLTTGARHWVRDAPGTSASPLDEVLARAPVDEGGRMSYGGGGRTASLLCGGFALEGGSSQAVLRALPPLVHVRADAEVPVPWLAATVELLRAELESDAPGAREVICRLSDALLTQTFRTALRDLEADGGGRLGALRDREVAQAVELIERHPERAWTTGELAAEVALSRSAFAARFRDSVGESPRRYATRTRLALAARLLHGTDATLAEIAERTGYESEFSFSRAFKREFGLAPGVYRSAPDFELDVAVLEQAAADGRPRAMTDR